MNYTYNIKVNLKNELINFYEWNKMDKITILKKVPVFKVNDNVYENIISGRVKVNDTFLDKISLSNYTSIFCNDIDTICIKFDNKGKIDKLSKLDLIEEKDVLEKFSDVTKNYIEEQFNNYFDKISKEYETDIDCFSTKALAYFPTINDWNNYNWSEKFKDAKFDVDININSISSMLLTKT